MTEDEIRAKVEVDKEWLREIGVEYRTKPIFDEDWNVVAVITVFKAGMFAVDYDPVNYKVTFSQAPGGYEH